MRFPWTPTCKNWNIKTYWLTQFTEFSIGGINGYGITVVMTNKKKPHKIKTCKLGFIFHFDTDKEAYLAAYKKFGFEDIYKTFHKLSI